MKSTIVLAFLWIFGCCTCFADDTADQELNRCIVKSHGFSDRGAFDKAQPVLERIVELRRSAASGEIKLSRSLNDVQFALAYARLFYSHLTRGEEEQARSAISEAIKIHDEDGRFYLPSLNEKEKLLLTIQAWLAWEKEGLAHIDLEKVVTFYANF